MTTHINAEKCIDYLRRVGVEIPEPVAASWLKTQGLYRERRRANRRELKESCGHFSTHECRVYWETGAATQTVCNACGEVVTSRTAP